MHSRIFLATAIAFALTGGGLVYANSYANNNGANSQNAVPGTKTSASSVVQPNGNKLTWGETRNQSAEEILAKDPQLAMSIQPLFPVGTNVQMKARGFGHVSEFVATAHAAKNLGISFDSLKASMMNGSTLSQAIHQQRPDAHAMIQARRALREAHRDLRNAVAA